MNHSPAVNTSHDLGSYPRNREGELTTFDFLSPTEFKEVEALQEGAIQGGGLPTPYYTLNKRKQLEGINLSILDVHLTGGKVNGLIIRAKEYVMNLETGGTRRAQRFFLVTRLDAGVEVRGLGCRKCAKRAKGTVGLGLLTRRYMQSINQAPEATAVMSKSPILLEDKSIPTLRSYPARSAIPREGICREFIMSWARAERNA
ncbi:hypothetical protein [Polaromonas naphthalenivorans]|uniref:Uncharacterized protein n=1 Tax=Polaromonas naphthalenivorans (strain CJ2) TaxID=365044 RepID=A1VW63_POLNA|nr:hypothetical protein [Polaromonas naphthalenivorans]ABM39891.1 hypothetical protein Pnap_4826 [Polaromonas naphthalenivorans CJ2]